MLWTVGVAFDLSDMEVHCRLDTSSTMKRGVADRYLQQQILVGQLLIVLQNLCRTCSPDVIMRINIYTADNNQERSSIGHDGLVFSRWMDPSDVFPALYIYLLCHASVKTCPSEVGREKIIAFEIGRCVGPVVKRFAPLMQMIDRD